VPVSGLVARLAEARIGATFNQYAGSVELRRRLGDYLTRRQDAPLLSSARRRATAARG
jgi:hypothetical protein